MDDQQTTQQNQNTNTGGVFGGNNQYFDKVPQGSFQEIKEKQTNPIDPAQKDANNGQKNEPKKENNITKNETTNDSPFFPDTNNQDTSPAPEVNHEEIPQKELQQPTKDIKKDDTNNFSRQQHIQENKQEEIKSDDITTSPTQNNMPTQETPRNDTEDRALEVDITKRQPTENTPSSNPINTTTGETTKETNHFTNPQTEEEQITYSQQSQQEPTENNFSEQEASVPQESIEQEPEKKSDLGVKIHHLKEIIQSIFAIQNKEKDDALELIGSDNEKLHITYKVHYPQNNVSIDKIQVDRMTQTEVTHTLVFQVTENNQVEVIVDDIVLYDQEYLGKKENKRMQVTDKLNKFIFLSEELLKKAEKEKEEKEAHAQKRKELQDIFRNF